MRRKSKTKYFNINFLFEKWLQIYKNQHVELFFHPLSNGRVKKEKAVIVLILFGVKCKKLKKIKTQKMRMTPSVLIKTKYESEKVDY